MTKKTCNKCNEAKDTSAFSKSPSCKDGFQGTCKACVVIRNRDYSRTPKGRVAYIYATQVTCSKQRQHPKPEYTVAELQVWAQANGLDELVTAWAASGYSKDLCPSIDRLDTTKGYAFSNIRLVTWKDNNDAQYKGRLSGKVVTKQNRSVEQRTLDGQLVATYPSIAAAARATGVQRANINAQCTGYKPGPYGGFNWSYA
ncbi:MAG: hypothetical protein DI616_15680 [Paracoccus denitrificans]|uniref:Uncharacterized protein n=1 Tax=Paracoccus denitrificans TaxID=266 RepID=A0A533I0E7_PARDE|nr:MAG: hypothetical protein DI616_15680 [Paracoccus denitrificans]